MRKTILSIIIALAVSVGCLDAQINRHYYVWLSQGMLMENRSAEAMEALGTLLRADPDVHEGYLLRGVAKYSLGDMLGAEADFTTAIAKNEVYTDAYLYRGTVRMRLDNYAGALEDFDAAIELRPDREEGYFRRGMAYLSTEQPRQAVADFNRFLVIAGPVADALLDRGRAYLQLRDTTAAMEDYSLAIATNRDYGRSYFERGALHLAAGRDGEALADFDTALRLDPQDAGSLFDRSIILNRRSRPTEAIADLEKVAKLVPDYAPTYFNLALIRSSIGDYNRALEEYDTLVGYTPDNVLVYYNRAGLLYRLGELEGALKDYDRAIELYPDFASAYLGRSIIKYLLRDSRGAQRDRSVAETKIAEYRARSSDDVFSAYADPAGKFDELVSFDAKIQPRALRSSARSADISLRPLYKLTLRRNHDTTSTLATSGMEDSGAQEFLAEVGDGLMVFSNAATDIPVEELAVIDSTLAVSASRGGAGWKVPLRRGVVQSLMGRYAGAIASYSEAIDSGPASAFLYIGRSVARAEMTDFISSMEVAGSSLSLDGTAQENRPSNRIYNYDEAIADLDRAALGAAPAMQAYIHYNRGNLLTLSGSLADAVAEYTRAIELRSAFADAYYNRALVEIYSGDIRAGLLDMGKAGELGIKEAYEVIKHYNISL